MTCRWCGRRCSGRECRECALRRRDEELRRNNAYCHACSYPTEAAECPNCGALREERP